MKEDDVKAALNAATERLDPVLNDWGFHFVPDEVQLSHCGFYASGHYCRDTTRIGISCRETIDNIYYRHSFITQNRFTRHIEQFTILHDTLMAALGHAEDCRLVSCDQTPVSVAARDGGDPVDAWLDDLLTIAARVLRQPSEEFDRVVKRGSRSFSVESD